MKLQRPTQKVILQVVLLSIIWLVGHPTPEVTARTSLSNTPATMILAEKIDHSVKAGQEKGEGPKEPAFQNGSGNYQIFLPIVLTPRPVEAEPEEIVPTGCDHTIRPKIDVADGRDNYASVDPGDIVCIKGGKVRGPLILKNFKGTAEKPIIFRNFAGQVLIDSDTWYGLRIQNSQHFVLTGTGSSDEYGFKLIHSTSHGLRISHKSENFTVDHIEVTEVAAVGIMVNTDGDCSDASNVDYDYDNDGQVVGDKDDVINRDRFVQQNSIFYHNYIHNVGTEGFYIGDSHYEEGKNLACSNGTETVYDPLLHEVHVYDNLIEDTGWDGLQVGSATEACTIHHNRIYRDSLANEPSQQSGIMNNPGSVCDIYNNYIKESGSQAIYLKAYGDNQVYNNIIENPGHLVLGSGIIIARQSSNGNIAVFNNTIIHPSEHGILHLNENGKNNIIENNLIVKLGSSAGEPIMLGYDRNVTLSNNLTKKNIDKVKFVDPLVGNYALQADSPALDAGKSQPITFDYFNAPRPQGLGFDIGAVEQ